jgi:rare lipoprotein A
MKAIIFALLLPASALAGTTQVGVASWYGKENSHSCTGKRLTNRVPALAHKSLPIGTRVRVTNLKTKRSVVAVVEDRGPYCKRRIVDLNRIAARRLGMEKSGIAKVKIETLDKKS